MSEAAVLTDVRGQVLVITLNRPDAMNAFDHSLAVCLAAAIERLDADDDLAVGVLTGAGRGFCAGMDLKAFLDGDDVTAIDPFLQDGSQKPMVAAVEGFALAGGLELTLACDLIVAAEGSRFGLPEVTVGLFAAGGGLVRLPIRMGLGRAMEMALTGKPITADEALAAGLVTRVVPKGEALEHANRLAEQIAQNAPLGVRASKRLLRLAAAGTEDDFWAVHGPLKDEVFNSDDGREGPAAFAEKRSPHWTGR